MINTLSSNFLMLYTKSLLKLKYRHTYLGFLWNFLEPALYLIVLSVIFSTVNRMNIGNYAVYLFGALVPWRYFERTVGLMMESIVGGDWLLKKMPVSASVFPVSRWLIATVEFLFSFFVVLLLFLVIKTNWSIHLLVLPLSMVPWAVLGMGIGLLCSVLSFFSGTSGRLFKCCSCSCFLLHRSSSRRISFEPHSLQAVLLSLHPITYFAALFQKPLYYGAWPSDRPIGQWQRQSAASRLLPAMPF